MNLPFFFICCGQNILKWPSEPNKWHPPSRTVLLSSKVTHEKNMLDTQWVSVAYGSYGMPGLLFRWKSMVSSHCYASIHISLRARVDWANVAASTCGDFADARRNTAIIWAVAAKILIWIFVCALLPFHA